MKLSLILEAIDRATAPVRKVERSVDRLARGGFGRLEGAMRKVDQVEKRILGAGFRARLVAFEHRMERLVRVGGRWALEKGAYGAGVAIGWTIRKMGELLLRIGQLGVVGAGIGIGFLTKGVIATASKFEQFQVVLENTEGSADKARKAMAWVKDFAKSTPYEIGDVMEAFVALKAYGIDPADGSLRSLGDAASGMGKGLMQAVEALADAQTGEFERLKEFGIRASKQGQQVTFTYQKAGKEITRTARMSAVEINHALTGILNERFAGMMDRQSRTVAGMWSNLMDMITNFQLDIGSAGFFDVVKSKLQSVLDLVNAAAKDGRLEAWAKRISAQLENMVKLAFSFTEGKKWEQLTKDINDLTAALGGLLAFLDAIKQKGDQAAGVLNTIRDRMNAGADFQRKYLPINGFAVIGMARDAYHDLFPDKPKVRPVPSAPRSRGGIDKAWRQALGPGGGSPTARGAWDQAIRNPKPTKIQIDVKAAPGLIASPARIDRGDADLDLYTGRAMQGF